VRGQPSRGKICNVDQFPMVLGFERSDLEFFYLGAKPPLFRWWVNGKPDALSAGKIRLPGYSNVPTIVVNQVIDLAH